MQQCFNLTFQILFFWQDYLCYMELTQIQILAKKEEKIFVNNGINEIKYKLIVKIEFIFEYLYLFIFMILLILPIIQAIYILNLDYQSEIRLTQNTILIYEIPYRI